MQAFDNSFPGIPSPEPRSSESVIYDDGDTGDENGQLLLEHANGQVDPPAYTSPYPPNISDLPEGQENLELSQQGYDPEHYIDDAPELAPGYGTQPLYNLPNQQLPHPMPGQYVDPQGIGFGWNHSDQDAFTLGLSHAFTLAASTHVNTGVDQGSFSNATNDAAYNVVEDVRVGHDPSNLLSQGTISAHPDAVFNSSHPSNAYGYPSTATSNQSSTFDPSDIEAFLRWGQPNGVPFDPRGSIPYDLSLSRYDPTRPGELLYWLATDPPHPAGQDGNPGQVNFTHAVDVHAPQSNQPTPQIPATTAHRPSQNLITSQALYCPLCSAKFTGRYKFGNAARHRRNKHQGNQTIHCEEDGWADLSPGSMRDSNITTDIIHILHRDLPWPETIDSRSLTEGYAVFEVEQWSHSVSI